MHITVAGRGDGVPQAMATARLSGVSRKLPAAATQQTSAYSKLGCTDQTFLITTTKT